MPFLRSSLKLIGAAAIALLTFHMPAKAQQWGLLYPDGSIRNRYGVMLEGPDPSRYLQLQQTMPINRQSIDLNTGAIYRGNLLEEGPNPGRRMAVCLQTGLC